MLKSGISVWRLIALTIAVLLEGAALLSVILSAQLVPLGTIYPNVISVAVYLLPALVGFLARHIQSALFLAMLPFWALTMIYAAIYAPAYESDLFQLGVLAQRVAFTLLLMALLGLFGWLLRRMTVDRLLPSRQAIPEPSKVTAG